MFSHFSTLCMKGSLNPVRPDPFRVRVGLVGIIFACGPYLHRAITYDREKFFNLTPTVEKRAFIWLNSNFHENQMMRCYDGQMCKIIFFSFGRTS